MKVIAVDFDGVLHDPHNPDPGFRMGKPIPGARESMEKLKTMGFRLVIFTVRAQPGIDLHYIESWMGYFGIPFDDIAMTKPKADYYIDDNAIRFESWNQTLIELHTYENNDPNHPA